MCMLDAALHSGGQCRHIRRIRNLFKCAASSIRSNTKNLLTNVFDGFVPEPVLPPGVHQAVDRCTGRMFWFNTQTKLVQWTRPGLPLPVSKPSVVANGSNTTTVPSDPSPTSVAEVPATTTEENAGTPCNNTMAVEKTTAGAPSDKRMPFGNKSNSGTSSANINTNPLKGKPTGILKGGTVDGAHFKPRTNLVLPHQEIDCENIVQQY
jgi:hypothetical protein